MAKTNVIVIVSIGIGALLFLLSLIYLVNRARVKTENVEMCSKCTLPNYKIKCGADTQQVPGPVSLQEDPDTGKQCYCPGIPVCRSAMIREKLPENEIDLQERLSKCENCPVTEVSCVGGALVDQGINVIQESGPDKVARACWCPRIPKCIQRTHRYSSSNELQDLVGTDAVDAENEIRLRGYTNIRVASPGERLSMDFVPTRVNVYKNEEGKVIDISFG